MTQQTRKVPLTLFADTTVVYYRLFGPPRQQAHVLQLAREHKLDPGGVNGQPRDQQPYHLATAARLTVCQALRGCPVYVHLNGLANTWLK